jgi:phage gpG-like protein
MSIEFTIDDARVQARLAALPEKARRAIADVMKQQWFRIQSEVVRGKLSGDPLHRRTGVLASSINVGGADSATEFVEDATSIMARIGTNVRYAAIHEDGGTVQIPAHIRHITQVFGHPVAGRDVEVRAHTAVFPQRSFLRSTLREMTPTVLAAIEAALSKTLKE